MVVDARRRRNRLVSPDGPVVALAAASSRPVQVSPVRAIPRRPTLLRVLPTGPPDGGVGVRPVVGALLRLAVPALKTVPRPGPRPAPANVPVRETVVPSAPGVVPPRRGDVVVVAGLALVAPALAQAVGRRPVLVDTRRPVPVPPPPRGVPRPRRLDGPEGGVGTNVGAGRRPAPYPETHDAAVGVVATGTVRGRAFRPSAKAVHPRVLADPAPDIQAPRSHYAFS